MGVTLYQKRRKKGSNNITGNVKDCKSFNESSNLSLISHLKIKGKSITKRRAKILKCIA
jgi:hypothetical protein